MYKKYIIILLIILLLLIIYIIKYINKTHDIKQIYTNKLNNLIDTKLNNNHKKLFIVPQPELGDHIALNGAIQYLSKQYDIIILVCKKAYYKQISYMYQNLNNIIFYIIPNYYTLPYLSYYVPVNHLILKKFRMYNITYLNYFSNKIKFAYLTYKYDFVTRMYIIINLNSNIGYDYFKVPRDHERENNLYNRLIKIIGTKYVIVIDDEKRNFLISNKYINDIQLPIFKLSINSKNKDKRLNDIKSEYIFDYIKILANAEKIFSIDTSLLWLIDFLNINTPTYAYCARNDNCVYRNKNIHKLKVFYKDYIVTNLNLHNYVFKLPIDEISSVI
jgi:hypothetical protein